MVKTAKEKPILFSIEMVKAILDGRKSQTRRVVKPQPPEKFKYPMQWSNGDVEFSDVPGDDDMANWWPGYERPVKCPYPPGTILWVRETFADLRPGNLVTMGGSQIVYKATSEGTHRLVDRLKEITGKGWRPSIHMPREAARLFLEVTNVRVERLQEISWEDVLAEGVLSSYETYCLGFVGLWNSINGKKYPWDSNPWVFVIEFRVVD